MKSGLKRLQRSFSAFLIILTFTISVGLMSPTPAVASVDFHFPHTENIRKTLFDFHFPHTESIRKTLFALHSSHAENIREILSDKQLLNEANQFLNESPVKLCSIYLEKDSATWLALQRSAEAAFVVTGAITQAAAAGAGTLTGYAGIASAVSHLGLGGLTTSVAGFMGSHATGAAATSLVTSAIGGPVVMGTLLVGGTGAAVFGTYTLARVAIGKMGLTDWAEQQCPKIMALE